MDRIPSILIFCLCDGYGDKSGGHSVVKNTGGPAR